MNTDEQPTAIQVVTLKEARKLVGMVTPTRSGQRKAGQPVSRQLIYASDVRQIKNGYVTLFVLEDIYTIWPETRQVDLAEIGISIMTIQNNQSSSIPDLTAEQKAAIQTALNLARQGVTEETAKKALPHNLHPAQRIAAEKTIQGILGARH